MGYRICFPVMYQKPESVHRRFFPLISFHSKVREWKRERDRMLTKKAKTHNDAHTFSLCIANWNKRISGHFFSRFLLSVTTTFGLQLLRTNSNENKCYGVKLQHTNYHLVFFFSTEKKIHRNGLEFSKLIHYAYLIDMNMVPSNGNFVWKGNIQIIKHNFDE